MADENWQKVREVFTSALRRKPEERRKFVNQVCGEDKSLLAEVESLLASMDNSESFMELPAVGEVAESLVAENCQFASGQNLGHYEIVRQIGAGGMGEVYLAQDTRLKRKVALKCLFAQFTSDRERLSRFNREAEAASALNHPNILTIHEIGVEDEVSFIATEFIEGETLREKLQKGCLPLEEALDIAIQTADALSAAHSAGVIHRDIKPENIMIRRDNLVKILDFGLAKLIADKSNLNTEAKTKAQVESASGMIMGTASYMSPEQARGKTLDARTDIFSFGIVIYKMLTGRNPFAGETANDVMTAILKIEPAPLGENIPTELQRIVRKTLQKNADHRYQTAKDLLADLKNLQKRLEFEAELIRERENITMIQPSPLPPVASSPHPNSIAVLPFANLSADEENDYFCDGLAEELLNALTKIEDLKVSARTSAFLFKDKNMDVSEIGNALNVKIVLKGNVRKWDNRLRITVQLFNAADGFQIWSERYDRTMQDIFNVQDEIALAVVNALKLKLFGKEKAALLKRYTDNAEAYQLYLRGRFFWNKRTPEGFKKAIENFEQAVRLDSDYVPAHSGLADCYTFLGFYEAMSPAEIKQKAQAAFKALRLDDTLAETNISLAIILAMNHWAWTESKKLCEKAIKINPNYTLAYHAYSGPFAVEGRFDKAIEAEKRAVELEPFTPILNATLAWWYYLAHRYTEATEQSLKTIEIAPDHFFAHWILGITYSQKAMFAEAVAELQKAVNLSGDSLFIKAELGRIYAASGQTDEALKLLGELTEQAKGRYVSPCNMAKIYAGLGENEQVFEWLEKACEERAIRLPWLIQDPFFDNLRSDSRFQNILRRVGLPQ